MSEPDISTTGRAARTASTFVELIDTLVDDFDVIEMLTVLASRSVELLGASEAGIMLADSSGHLRVMAASSDRINVLELFQIQNEQGPCVDSYRTGSVIAEADLRTTREWPEFASECVAAGYPSVCAVPLRLRARIIGCLNLFMSQPFALDPDDVRLAQALADVASIAILQDQAARDAATREANLQHALDSRISIEQAKGMVAEHLKLDMDAAFNLLRSFARSNNRRLTDVARSLVDGDVMIAQLASET